MNYYESKRQARIDRLNARIASLKSEAAKGSLKIFTEEHSGIPMGQPILVGHHSERRHRKHLERLDNKMRKAVEADKEASRLQDSIESMQTRKAIDSDNPEALRLLDEKIAKLTDQSLRWTAVNKLVRRAKGSPEALAALLVETWPNEFKTPLETAGNLLKPDFAGRVGIADYQFRNLSAEIRRLKKRREALTVVQAGFEPFTVNGCKVEVVNGQLQVEFPAKPSDASRSVLKRSPLVLKWSSYSGRWVRKHTETTASRYFKQELIRALEAVTYD